MTTAFSAVVAAIVDKLKAAPAVCGAIYRARSTAISEQLDQAVSVQFERSVPTAGAIGGAPIDWSSVITVECFASSMQVTGDLAVDPLFKAVFARLAEDTTLGGLVGDLAVAGVEADYTAGGRNTGWMRLTYVAEHRTQNSTLE